MKTLNSIQLIGYLGGEPVTRTAVNGSKLTRLRLATGHSFRVGKEGELIHKTSWHDVKAWDTLSEKIPAYLTTGSHIMVQGVMEYRSYTNKRGERCRAAEVRAFSIIDLDR